MLLISLLAFGWPGAFLMCMFLYDQDTKVAAASRAKYIDWIRTFSQFHFSRYLAFGVTVSVVVYDVTLRVLGIYVAC